MNFAAYLLFTWFFFRTFVVWSRQPAFEIGSTDFPALVESGTYIDKSLIVKTYAALTGLDLFKEVSIEPQMFISAPQNFGKTINILTLKHYFEIEVDEDGNEIIDKRKTKNYSLFEKLKIFKHREFFNATFGRYPVIHVNFEPINRITNNRTMYENLKTVILETLLQHKYLLNSKSPNISRWYKNYIEHGLEKKNPKEIDYSYALGFLWTLLRKHFNQKPIKLIDNCDAVFNAIVFGNTSEDVGRLCEDYHMMHCYGFLATGTLYIGYNHADGPYDIHWNHQYFEYYGINDRELCELLKFTNDSNEAEMLKADIRKFYGTYIGNKRTLYSTSSVLKYLQNRKLGDPHALRSYWETPTFLKSIIRNLLNMDTVREIALLILKNKTIPLDYFCHADTFKLWDAEFLKRHIHEGFDDKLEADYLFKYLAALGYFSRFGIKHILVIPNLEIRTELENILRQQGASDDGNNR